MERSHCERIRIQSPTLELLRKVAARARRRFPDRLTNGLDCLGLIVDRRLKNGGYWCSPDNSLQFASTGGEGTHFSFLVTNGRINDSSPVVITTTIGGQSNFIVGASLRDFLCLGYYRGYFALEQLASDYRKTLKIFGSGRWEPESQADWWVGYGVNDGQRPVLEFLRTEMALKPWRDLERKFERLQRLYLQYLTLRADRFSAEIVVEEIKSWSRWNKED